MTFTVTDNKDGTANFTVTGTPPSNENEFFYSPLELPAPPQLPAWTSIGFISGDGSLVAAVPVGLKWFYCQSTSLALAVENTPPIPALVTASPTAIMEQILSAVETVIRGLVSQDVFAILRDPDTGLPRTDAVARQDQLSVTALEALLPAVAIRPGDKENFRGGTNASTDLEYPVLVGLIDQKDKEDTRETPDYYLVREYLRQLFNERRLPGVDGNFYCKVEFGRILDSNEGEDDDEEYLQFASDLFLIFYQRELRWT